MTVAPDVEEDVITDPERIQELLNALVAQRAVGVVRMARDPSAPPVAVKLEPPGLLLMDWSTTPPSPPLWVEVTGYCSAYHFLLKDRASFPQGVTEVRRIRSRRQRRVAAPPRAFVLVEIGRDGGGRVQHPLRDVSMNGLSFTVTDAPNSYAPGQNLTFTVEWKGGTAVRLQGEVCHCSASADGRSVACGVRIHHLPDAEEQVWRRELDQLLYPGTRTLELDADQLWELYDNSGYFRLSDKSARHFASLKTSFSKATRVLESAPHLGVRVARVTERGIEGSVSQLKVFSGTWLVYQLARMEKGRPLWSAGSDVLRELHVRGYEHAARDPDLRWLLSYVQDAARFSRLLQHDVPARYASSGRSCLVPFHALEAQFTPADVPAADPDVGAATADETRRLVAIIRSTRPQPWCEAYDYVPERFSLEKLQDQWARAGLRRQRRILVVRRRGEATAAAILESVEDGLHLFGLLDAVRVFPLLPGGEEDFGTLLRQARRFYAEAGKSRYVYFNECDDTAHLEGLSFADMGRASTTVLPADLLPELMERLYEVTAPTPPTEERRSA